MTTSGAEYQRRRREDLIARGLCIFCREPNDRTTSTLCLPCYTKHKVRMDARKARLQGARQCVLCTQPVDGPHDRCSGCLVKHNTRHREDYRRLQTQVIEAYGGACYCCGDRDPAFLSLDHTNNDGNQHRQVVRPGWGIFKWARDNGYPPTLRLACFNCNLGRARAPGKICPHQFSAPVAA